ncbi:MAG: winged helix-turn-helix domain-containing protein [Frankiaceae bacterium]
MGCDQPAGSGSVRSVSKLAAEPNRTFSREQLLHGVFDAADTSGVVDTYVHYLWRKLGRDVVRTVHGLGYRLGQT